MIKNDFFGVTLNISFPIKIHPGRITQKNKDLVNNLNYERIKILVLEKKLLQN